MKPKQPLITIIVATLNCADTIERCLESIVSQTYPHKELILIDGGSRDATVEILANSQNNITYWKSKPDRGIYHAWNKALKHSHGEWICFLGADDFFWNDHVLADLVPYLKKSEDSGTRVVYGQTVRVNSHGHVLKLRGKPWEKIRWYMLHGMPLDLPHTGLMHHHSLFEDAGPFDETFRIAGDYDFLLRELKDKQAIYVENLKIAGCMVGGIADSNNILAHKEVARARRKNGLQPISWVWLIVYTRALFRKKWQRLLDHLTLT